MDTLEIKEAIDKAIENYLYEKEPILLYDAVKHLPFAGGKRLRPIIACLACEAVGSEFTKAIPFAVALELIHTFTLVHDDIMDKDEERRGMPAVHKKFGENIAILAGDALFAKAFEVASYIKDAAIAKTILRNLAMMAKEICEGQELDIRFEEMEYVEEKQFLEMIEKKTAKMFEHAAMGGAIIGGGNEKEVKALQEYGKSLGMAFQIWDDCLDVIGKDIGKPVGSDIREGKKTLIYLYAYKNSEDKQWLKNYGKEDASKEEIDEIIKFFEEVGAIEYAKNKAMEFANKAKEALNVLRESEAKEKLAEMAEFAVKREK
ncbi:MAG: polyprenyl synthetase family protein [Thermoplasmata archaeon]|nr:MAG: polyprenyl synthetase family protein [Thermoplasmata archaeon]HDN96120.1 polyprenyl synthetase family protein [Thermoplasmatales archaeon]